MNNIFIALKSSLIWLIMLSSLAVKAQVENTLADEAIDAYNNAFLSTTGGRTYYKRTLTDDTHDGTWTLALDIFGMQDTYERTGSADHKKLVNDLCNSFLLFNPPPYSWDGWNDDIAWMGLALARGYQITGTEDQLTQAKYCFNMAYDRGWNTQFNNGGIWEQQPDMSPDDPSTNKEALSNNPMGHLACLIYQSTGEEYYLEKAIQIYEWSRNTIFNPINGQVYAGVFRDDNINTGTAVYNQGSFVDFATTLYELTGKETILRDAQMAANYTINNLTTNGIITNSADYLNTWADTYVRGVGHLCRSNPQLWNTYYPLLLANAASAWKYRRTDLNISWNAWDTQTPNATEGIPTKYVSTVALLQNLPIVQSIIGDIEAEDYNFMKGITVENITAGGKCVGSLEAGDWLEYIVNIQASGNYTITINAAALNTSTLQFQQNNITLQTITIPATGSLENYFDVRVPVKLTAGINSIKIKAIAGNFTINKLTGKTCELITPLLSVNGESAEQQSSVTVNAGSNLSLNPTPNNGIWSWTGPNNFQSGTRVVTFNAIQQNQGGTYTAIYKSTDGCISVQDFTITLNNCSPTSIVSNIKVDGNTWLNSNGNIRAGSFVTIDLEPQTGTWNWTGPNGFISDSHQISLINITYKQSGDYTATFTNASGCRSSKTISLPLTGQDPCSTPITPYLNVNNAAWLKVAYASVNVGGTISVGPQPFDGTWKWSGPNDFISEAREFMITNFKEDNAGHYKATYTNAAGCVTITDFIIGLKDCVSSSIEPEILVNGNDWARKDSITVVSGDNIIITPPDSDGQWNWIGPGNISFKSKQLSFENILNIREGKYTLSFADEAACISSYGFYLEVIGDDICGSIIEPYMNINNVSWEQTASALLNKGDKITVGPHPTEKGRWIWNGPDNFVAATREYTINNIQDAQSGMYSAKLTNNFGCVSFIDCQINVIKIITDADDENEFTKSTCFPNPATDIVILTNLHSHTPITVFTLSGQKIIQTTSNTNGNFNLDIKDFKAGFYLIKIGDGQTTLKLIKTN